MKIDVELGKQLETAEAYGLRSAVEHAIAAFPGRGITVEEIAGGTVAYCGAGSYFNQATGAGVSCTVSDDDVERIVSFFHSRGEPARVELSPVADPELARKLARRGFVIDDYENALTADLRELSGARDPRIGQCRDAELWAEMSGRGFTDGAEPDERLNFIGIIMATHPSVTPLVLRENGDILATACLGTEFDGIAGFFATSTVPQARGRGFHGALIADRIARAKEMGKSVARATAKPGSVSERNFRRFGFTPVFTRTIWLLDPPTS